jgi:hypothetical protein
VHNWNAGGSIVSAAVIRKQEDADKRMLVNRSAWNSLSARMP